MLVIDGTSVYEIDEECVKKRGVSRHCGIDDKLTERMGHRPKEPGADILKQGKQRENS